ncbi:polymorphic toxin-type HINT domain-containing protein [Chlorogloeopsis sp. ULAP02]|uniref:polymorphic toxin-type HINT domain-containing protein n=1 Tax=Chlorogloeopsis sp. ULAP02 TaxID=3107926 RepID=UPI003135E422
MLTTEGIKNIEDIQVGDWVIADDPTTPGEIEARQVLNTVVRHTNKLVDIYIDGEVISTTEEHPFWTPDKGWVEAKNLEVGSLLQTDDSRIIDVDKIEKREGDFTVYNFAVEGWHTYFVSDLGVLVHNTQCPIPNYKQGGKYTEPTLPDKVVAEKGEVKIVHNYRSNDHAPAHVHIIGGGPETRIKISGETMPGDPSPTTKQQKVIDENLPLIRKKLKKIIQWLKYQDLPNQ